MKMESLAFKDAAIVDSDFGCPSWNLIINYTEAIVAPILSKPFYAMLSKICIVLVRPSHPGNIGATARAMKTMGLSRLCLVEPKQFPHVHAVEMASGAVDILEQAQVYSSLKDAIAECQLVIGTSARKRYLTAPILTPDEAANKLITKIKDKAEVAIVFGAERTGLTNDELIFCHQQVMIPTNEVYQSLNLAQAVQILSYECRKHYLTAENHDADEAKLDSPPAKAQEVDAMVHHFKALMYESDFFKPTGAEKVIYRLRRLFNKAQLEIKEVNLLRGILTAAQKAIKLRRD